MPERRIGLIWPVKVSNVRSEANGFTINETEITSGIKAEEPELVYLSLPNNPTGAVFNPEDIVKGVPEKTTLLFDVTLPSREHDSRALSTRLYNAFRERKKPVCGRFNFQISQCGGISNRLVDLRLASLLPLSLEMHSASEAVSQVQTLRSTL